MRIFHLVFVVGVAFSSLLRAQTSAATNGAVASAARAPAAGANFSIPDLNLELIWVKPGSFTMGSPSDEPMRNKAEGPQTHVTFTKGFWLGKTEVTQGQYEALVGENPSGFKNVGKDGPVERVSWTDAMAFCKKLTEQERSAGRLPAGYEYTLPTEAQWEYAYRAGTMSEYPGDPNETAWHSTNSAETTHPVAQKKPNAWGFYDMAGNVLEWTYDWYGEYPGGSVTDPKGPFRGYYRTGRGGSWRTEARVGRSAARSGGSEARVDYTIGFRVALAAR
jgi:formylglycine-generating enzyme required for sulfatase activity